MSSPTPPSGFTLPIAPPTTGSASASQPSGQPQHASTVAPAPSGATKLAEAGARINAELKRERNSQMTLSTEAREELESVQANLLADVGQEAIRIARRDGLRTVDPTHVRLAATHIGAANGRRVFPDIFNTLGGLFAGAGIASVYAILFTAGTNSGIEIAVGVGLTAIGTALLAAGITATLMQR